jgi:hypothetical protein
VALYTYVWLNTAFINMSLSGLWLIQRDQRTERFTNKMASKIKQFRSKLPCGFLAPAAEDEVDNAKAELVKIVNESIVKIVDLYKSFVIVLVAGPLVPMLTLMMTFDIYVQLLCLQRVHVLGQRSFGTSAHILAASMLLLLVCCCCWYVVAVGMLLLLVCCCCWYVVAVGMLLLLVCCCCWYVVAASMLLLLVYCCCQ